MGGPAFLVWTWFWGRSSPGSSRSTEFWRPAMRESPPRRGEGRPSPAGRTPRRHVRGELHARASSCPTPGVGASCGSNRASCSSRVLRPPVIVLPSTSPSHHPAVVSCRWLPCCAVHQYSASVKPSVFVEPLLDIRAPPDHRITGPHTVISAHAPAGTRISDRALHQRRLVSPRSAGRLRDPPGTRPSCSSAARRRRGRRILDWPPRAEDLCPFDGGGRRASLCHPSRRAAGSSASRRVVVRCFSWGRPIDRARRTRGWSRRHTRKNPRAASPGVLLLEERMPRRDRPGGTPRGVAAHHHERARPASR